MSVKALPNYVFCFHAHVGLLSGNPFGVFRTWRTADGTPGPYRPASERALLIVGEATRPCAVAPYVTDPGLNWLCLQIDLLCLVYQHWSTYIF